MHRKKGFTLVELLIVIAILSILSTLGVTNFQTARIKARDLNRKSDLASIAKSLEAYVNDHRSYPTSDTSFRIKCKTDGSICDWGAEFSDTTGTVYIIKLPSDPGQYSYRYYSTGTSYTLHARLENNQDSSLIPEVPGTTCGGTSLCNYKVSSSNIL